MAFHQCRSREKYALGPWRGGKSLAGANELLDEIVRRPQIDGEPTRWGIIVPTYKGGRAIVDYTLLRYIPADIRRRVSRQDNEIELIDGTLIYVRSTERPEGIETLGDLDGIWADEVEHMPEYARIAMTGRLSMRHGNLWGTTTPRKWHGLGQVRRLSWLYELFTEEGIAFTPGASGIYTGRTDVSCVVWTARDNPHFDTAEEERLREKWGPAWAAQFLDAGYVDLYAGEILRREWFRSGEVPPPAAFDYACIAFDPAVSTDPTACYSVAQVWARAGADYWCLHEARGRFEYPDQKKLLTELAEGYTMVREIVIEDVAAQRYLIQDLHRDYERGLMPIDTRGIRPDGSKEARARVSSATLAAGRVVFAPHVLTPDFISEVEAFPAAPYADRVDAMTYGIQACQESEGVPALDVTVSSSGRRGKDVWV